LIGSAEQRAEAGKLAAADLEHKVELEFHRLTTVASSGWMSIWQTGSTTVMT